MATTGKKKVPPTEGEMETKEKARRREFTGPLWLHYDVTIKMRDILVGGYPKNPESEKAMLRARGLEDLIPPDKDPAAMTEEEKELAAKLAVQKSATGFKEENGQFYLESRNIKAMLKECANILKGDNILAVKNFKSKVAERIFVEPYKIFLGDKPAGTDERVVHVMTMQGPRSSIKFYDFFKESEIRFRLKVLTDDLITENDIKVMLAYAQENGLGADRSQGFGQFDVISFEKVSDTFVGNPLLSTSQKKEALERLNESKSDGGDGQVSNLPN